MKPTILTLIVALGLLAAPAMADTSWTRTGPNGGTSQGTAICTRGDGTLTCQSTSTYTGPNGTVFTRTGSGSATKTTGQRTVTTTGPNGGTTTKTRSWSR